MELFVTSLLRLKIIKHRDIQITCESPVATLIRMTMYRTRQLTFKTVITLTFLDVTSEEFKALTFVNCTGGFTEDDEIMKVISSIISTADCS